MNKSLHWDITKKCNLRCAHCYNAEKYFSNQNDYLNELSFDDCVKIIDKAYNEGFNHLHFLGGEPLACEFLIDIIKYAKKYKMKVTINSNATLLSSDMQDKLIEVQLDQYAASLDGCTAISNDAIRGNGTFDKVVKNMTDFNNKLKRTHSNMQTVLVYTLTNRNLSDLNLLYPLAKKIGVDLITLTTFIESGNGRINKDSFEVNYINLCRQIEAMIKNSFENVVDIALQIDMRPLFCDFLASKYNAPIIWNLKNSLCCAGDEIWYLEANGFIHPCLVYQLDEGKQELEKGRIIKQNLEMHNVSIENIKNSMYWKTFLKEKNEFDNSKIETCKNCPYLNSCKPCFAVYNSYEKQIIECQWVKDCANEEFVKLAHKRLVLNKSVQIINNIIIKDNIPILNFNSGVFEEFIKGIKNGSTLWIIYNDILSEYDVQECWLKVDLLKLVYTLLNNMIIKYEE